MDKPAGISSFAAVKVVKRALKLKKAGHLGTLDPMATGLLVIAANRTTRLIPFLPGTEKTYYAVVKLGEETDSQDLWGNLTKQSPVPEIGPDEIEDVLKCFRGEIFQVPPMYSALKKEGQPLYRLARQGIEVERSPRPVRIFSLQCYKVSLPFIYLRASCSAGTYIRTLAADIGHALGCGAILYGLRRTASDGWNVAHSICLWDFKKSHRIDLLQQFAVGFDAALDGLPQVQICEARLPRLCHGQPLKAGEYRLISAGEDHCLLSPLAIKHENRLVAVGYFRDTNTFENQPPMAEILIQRCFV